MTCCWPGRTRPSWPSRNWEPARSISWYRPLSILAEPPVTVVDKVALRKGTRDVADAYLKYLYSPTGQEIIARHFYRPRDPAVAAKYASRFPQLKLLTIADFGGWPKAQSTHFGEGGIFDQIYAPE